MPACDALRFSAAARLIAAETRLLRLEVPVFRSPPGIAGTDRTIRRNQAVPVIAVAFRGRELGDVVADLAEGVVVANGLHGRSAQHCRQRLVRCAEGVEVQAA